MPKDKTMEEIKKALKELAESQKKTDQEITSLTEKTDREIATLSKEIRDVNKMVGDLISGWGKFVEGIVEPSCVKLLTSFGIKIKT